MSTILMVMKDETDEKSKAANKEFREQVYAYAPSLDLPSKPKFIEISSSEADFKRIFEEKNPDAVFTMENELKIQAESQKSRNKTFEWQFSTQKMVRIFVHFEKMTYKGEEIIYTTIGYD